MHLEGLLYVKINECEKYALPILSLDKTTSCLWDFLKADGHSPSVGFILKSFLSG